MVHLSTNPTDDEMLDFVEQWIDLLAQEQFETAFRSTAHDPYYTVESRTDSACHRGIRVATTSPKWSCLSRHS